MTALYLVAFLGIAVAADWLTVLWHDARDKLDIMRVIVIGAAIETVNWTPIVVAIDAEMIQASWIAVANVLGTVIGSGFAISRLRNTVQHFPVPASKCFQRKDDPAAA